MEGVDSGWLMNALAELEHWLAGTAWISDLFGTVSNPRAFNFDNSRFAEYTTAFSTNVSLSSGISRSFASTGVSHRRKNQPKRNTGARRRMID